MPLLFVRWFVALLHNLLSMVLVWTSAQKDTMVLDQVPQRCAWRVLVVLDAGHQMESIVLSQVNAQEANAPSDEGTGILESV